MRILLIHWITEILVSMPRFLIHTILLVMAAGGVFFWLSQASLSPYTLQLVAILVLTYFGYHWFLSKAKSAQETRNIERLNKQSIYSLVFGGGHRSSITLDVTILTSMILLLVTETGALSSPFFFLCYFLLFGVAMLYEIEATLVLTGVLISFFLFLPGTKLNDLSLLSELLALIMITPLAIFTGHQYESTLEEKQARAKLTKHLVAEETDMLLFLSLNLKRTLVSALDSLSVVIPQEKVKDVRVNLQTLYQDLKNLYRSADELQSTIDKETDSQS